MTISKANDFRTRISRFKTFSELYDRNQGNGLDIQNNQRLLYIYFKNREVYFIFTTVYQR